MNNLKSYTEYAVTTPTTDFVIGFDFNYGTDAVNVTVDGVPATDAGYSVIYLNSTTMQLSPAVPSGVVRLQRETDIDAPDNQFTAGAKFIASNMDENFTQIRHSQQEVRDGFSKLSDDTYEIIDTLQVVGQAAQDAADAAEQAAQTANDAAAQVNDKVSYQDLDAAVDAAVAPVKEYIALPFEVGKSYDLNDRVMLDNGDIVRSTVAGNTTDPNVDMTGWENFEADQKEATQGIPAELATYAALRSYTGGKMIAVVGGRSNYFDGGFGRFAVKASDSTSADNGGTILVDAKGRRWHRIIQTEYGNPEWFGMSESVADNAPLVEKCLSIVGSAFIRRGEFPIQNTLRVLAGQALIGQVDKSIFVINDSTKAGILTHDYSTNNGVAKTQQGISIKNIRVKGTAKFGFGFTHCTQGDFSGLSIDGLTATDGYIFEGLWNCHFNDFKSNGAILTGSVFKINKIVLNSEFKAFYASNFCDYTLTVDSTKSEISVNNWAGFGDLIFEGLAAQGANKSGINLVRANNIIFNGLYTENCLAALHIGAAQTVTFNTCSFVGIRTASSLYEMWLGYSSANTMNGIVFNQCRHSSNDYPIIVDYAGLGITFNQPLVTLNTPLINKVQRTANTNGGIPLTIYRDSGGIGTTDVKKTNNYAWKFVVESVNDNNVVTRTTVIPPVTTATMIPL